MRFQYMIQYRGKAPNKNRYYLCAILQTRVVGYGETAQAALADAKQKLPLHPDLKGRQFGEFEMEI